MFETYYPERAEQPESADRYRDVPLGVEAAWPDSVSDETDLKPGGNRPAA
jgi:hypothetical protein